MKLVLVFTVVFLSFLLTSCSELTQDQSLVSFQNEQLASRPQTNYNTAFAMQFTPIPIKDWKWSDAKSGIELIFGDAMWQYDYVFAVIQQAEIDKSTLIFLERVTDEFFIPLNLVDVKDVRVYGIYNPTVEIGTYPFKYLQNFSHLGILAWEDGETTMKVAAVEWNAGNRDLFAEMMYESDRLLVYVGNPQSNVFELPKYGFKYVSELNLFATCKHYELPYDAK